MKLHSKSHLYEAAILGHYYYYCQGRSRLLKSGQAMAWTPTTAVNTRSSGHYNAIFSVFRCRNCAYAALHCGLGDKPNQLRINVAV